ncbi:hypothetical protein DY000_02038629 [Brassica cretica]|uniref:IBR domain-containing protein n=2 Tax=Brassica cretica TaxID=69181 RepID=A0ABQ7BD15_BRACR|nr:hypothetical protein DY000_02038629 [Brassica cretica]
MVKTKFTRNGREVMIWGGALRTFDYGSEEAVQQSNRDGNGGGSEEVVQQSKKGGKGGDGSVSERKRSAKKGGKRDASVAKTPTIKLECTVEAQRSFRKMVRTKRTNNTTRETTITKRRKKLAKEEEEEEEDDTPLTGIFCLKQRQDMKIFEEKEDCFILDFDPNDSFDSEKLSSSENPESDDDVAIVHEKGQVACRDYPHPRHLCLKYPFGSTNHQLHCNNCYCYVCDVAAPCPHWTPVAYESHCEASAERRWNRLRELHRK